MPYRTKTGWFVSGSSNTLTPAAGTGVGDLLLLLVTVRAGGTAGVNDALTVSAGWTQYGTRLRQTVTTGGTDEVMELWWRIATGSDSVTVTKVGSDLGNPASKLFSYRGISDATPFDVTGVASQGAAGATTTFTPTGITPVTDGAEVLSFIAIGNSTLNYPGLNTAQGFTLRDNEATAVSNQAIGLADRPVTPAGAVTMPTWDGFGTPREWVAYSLALRVAPIVPAASLPVASTSSVPRPAPSGASFVSVVVPTVAVTSAVPQSRIETTGARLASDLGTAAAKFAGTTLSLVVTAAPQPQIGDLVTVTCGRDDVGSDPVPDTLTDSAGNTWVRHTSTSAAVGDPSAGDGLVCSAFSSIISVPWTGTTTLTWTHPSVVARAMVARHFKPSAGHVFDLYGTPVGPSPAGSNPQLTLPTPVPGGWLLIAHFAQEYDFTQLFSYDAWFYGTIGGPWSTPLVATTTGGAVASNVFALSHWKVPTSSVEAPLWRGASGVGADGGAILAAYREMPATGPALVGISTQNEIVAGTDVPELPFGWAPGDLLMLIIGARPEFAQGVSDTVTVIPGWTQGPASYRAVPSDQGISVQVWTKIAAPGEAAPLVTVGSSLSVSTAGWSTQMAAFRGLNLTSIYDIGPTIANAPVAASYTPPSYSTATADTLALSVVASGGRDTLVASGWRTAMGDVDWDSLAGDDHAVGLATAPLGPPGPTPPLTWRQTSPFGTHAWTAIALTLRTAPGTAATAQVAASTSAVGSVVARPRATPAAVASTSLVRTPDIAITGDRTAPVPAPVAATSGVPTPVVFQRPGNDDRAGALPLSALTGTQVGTLLRATGEAGTVYEVGWRDVWYTWPFLPAGIVTLTVTDLPPLGCEVAAWASTPTSAGEDYTSRSFLGRVTAPPYVLNVTHPGGPLTVAVALALGGA